MASFWQSFYQDLFAGIAGTMLGFAAKTGLDFFQSQRRSRTVRGFLNFPVGDILMIHSALFDSSRVAYNYPSCDMIATRRLANMLELAGKKEGRDFKIAPESSFVTDKGGIDLEVMKYNLILVGGPKRNKITGEILKRSAQVRYEMKLLGNGENRLYDGVTHHELKASRDTTESHSDIEDSGGESAEHDYGLIMSLPNPVHLDRGVLVVAGIHGPGTAGAATYLSDRAHIRELSRKRQGGIIQEVVVVKYAVASERIIDVSLI